MKNLLIALLLIGVGCSSNCPSSGNNIDPDPKSDFPPCPTINTYCEAVYAGQDFCSPHSTIKYVCMSGKWWWRDRFDDDAGTCTALCQEYN